MIKLHDRCHAQEKNVTSVNVHIVTTSLDIFGRTGQIVCINWEILEL